MQTLEAHSSHETAANNQWQKRRRTVHMQTDTGAPTLANELWQELHNTEDQSDASISTLITTMLRQHNAVDKQPKQSFYNQTKWQVDTTDSEARPKEGRSAKQMGTKRRILWRLDLSNRNQWNQVRAMLQWLCHQVRQQWRRNCLDVWARGSRYEAAR